MLEAAEEQSKPKNETDERWSSSVSPRPGAHKQSSTQSTAGVGKCSLVNKSGFPLDFQPVRFSFMHMPHPCTHTLFCILNPSEEIPLLVSAQNVFLVFHALMS